MKKIILGTIAIATTAVVSGVVVATINENQIGVPMSEEPQTIIQEPNETIEMPEIEYVPTKEEADVVVERIIEEKVEPKAEVIEPKSEPIVKTEEDEDVDPAYKALCEYVLSTANPDQLEGLRIYKSDAYDWLVKAGYKSVVEYLQDPNYLSKVHYPRSIYQTYYGLFTSCLNQK